jgi:hypothetical protein
VRVATTILSLVLMLVLGAQSCAVTLGGALGEDEVLALERNTADDVDEVLTGV